ncbi:hypothetical protein WAE58_06855 [Pedobacter panaciterrae]|uniref:Glycosyl hydrolase family 71 n=1 Tax=Pedobacter panaciterrae TaxID=363849 RepID=A0ABU8NIQ7_9SPHI
MMGLKKIFLSGLICISFYQTEAQVSSSNADTWVAKDALGRTIEPAKYKTPRKDKYAGIFYFIWQGAHGYDQHKGGAADGGVMPKTPGDTVSPYDITKLLKANPTDPKYGPIHAFHHWGEPYFGYYLADDEWVIRKHAQMLSDAGIDVIILDVTNAAIYLPQVTKIANTYLKMRAEGLSTPSISFIVNSVPKQTVNNLYEQIYKKGLFSNLWFLWKGKPLLLCPPEAVTPEIKNFFTTRHSWAWSKGQQWFADGKDKWPWLDHYPQSYGWHDSKDKAEQVTVSIAQHPMSNIGRSFHNGKEPEIFSTEKGLYFEEQWKRALEVDPEFVFITGWNEWVAMRFNDGASKTFLGKSIEKGETYFVDLYNAEFSRDAEPENGVTKDNYYYQLVDNVRKFKGTGKLPVYKTNTSMSIDGKFSDWKKIPAVYKDDSGDTFHRKHPGWGRINEYVNNTGRNDIIESRITSDQQNVYFYVKTKDPLTPSDSPDWMHLFIGVKGAANQGWEGFQYVVNQRVLSNNTATLHNLKKDCSLGKSSSIKYRTDKNELELVIPKKQLGIIGNEFTLDFKWADNSPVDGNAMHWLDKGDAAPNARFAYRYIKQ